MRALSAQSRRHCRQDRDHQRSPRCWFNGSSGDLVTTVWSGFDQDRTLGDGEEGARVAVPTWTYFMHEALAGPRARGTRARQHRRRTHFPETGLLASSDNPSRIMEKFMEGNLPKSKSTKGRIIPTRTTAINRYSETMPKFSQRAEIHAALSLRKRRESWPNMDWLFRQNQGRGPPGCQRRCVLPKNIEIEAALPQHALVWCDSHDHPEGAAPHRVWHHGCSVRTASLGGIGAPRYRHQLSDINLHLLRIDRFGRVNAQSACRTNS